MDQESRISYTINGINFKYGYIASKNVVKNSIVLRGESIATVKAANAVEDDDLVTLGQIRSQGAVTPNSVNISINDAATRLPYVTAGSFVTGGIQASRSAIANNIPIRSATGQLKAAPAVDSDDMPTFSQVYGIVNNALTASQTSAQLNALYPTAAIGAVYKSITNSVEYTKLNATQWKKEVLSIV